MASGGKYVASLPGLLKIINIVFGAISIGCAANALNLDEAFEKYFYGAAIGCFVVSILLFPIFLTASGDANKTLKNIDFLYHIILGIVLIVASSMQLKSAVATKNETEVPEGSKESDDSRNFDRKVAAGSFGLINSLVYFAVAVIVMATKEDEMNFRNYPKGG